METTLRAQLLELARLYQQAAGRPPASLGREVVNDSTFFRRIENGDGFTIKTYDKVVRWFSDHWPNGVKWPKGIERPAKSECDA